MKCPAIFVKTIFITLAVYIPVMNLGKIQIFTFYVCPALNVFQNFSFTTHILLHHADKECNILQTFKLQFLHDACFAENVQIAPSVQMNTEQGSSHCFQQH